MDKGVTQTHCDLINVCWAWMGANEVQIWIELDTIFDDKAHWKICHPSEFVSYRGVWFWLENYNNMTMTFIYDYFPQTGNSIISFCGIFVNENQVLISYTKFTMVWVIDRWVTPINSCHRKFLAFTIVLKTKKWLLVVLHKSNDIALGLIWQHYNLLG